MKPEAKHTSMKVLHYPDRITFRLDTQLVQDLEALAREHDRSINSMGRTILREGILRLKREKVRATDAAPHPVEVDV
jgi:hypothetical protein